jgi:hypothetical protein
MVSLKSPKKAVGSGIGSAPTCHGSRTLDFFDLGSGISPPFSDYILLWNPDPDLVSRAGVAGFRYFAVQYLGSILFDKTSWYIYVLCSIVDPHHVDADPDLTYHQCCRSGSTGSTCFWASRIRIRIH